MPGPLAGVKVMDLSQVVSGPMAGMVLADQGADVIKIEAVGGMDVGRSVGQQPNASVAGMGSTFATVNRGKRSLVLDFKQPRGVELFLKLVARTDVVIQNFRPGAVEGLGIGYEECRRANPDVIFVSISGFGEVGPYTGKPIYDPVIQGVAGVIAGQTDSGGEPALVQSLVCDKTTAMTAAQAITAALFARDRGQGGQHVRLSMLDAMLQFQWPEVFWNRSFPDAVTQKMPEFTSIYRLWRCKDGKITVVPLQDKEFFGFARAVGHPEWCEDPRFSSVVTRIPNVGTLIGMMEEACQEFTCEELLAKLTAADVPCGPVLSQDEVLEHPQVKASGTILESQHPVFGTLRMPRPAPRFSATPSFSAGAVPSAPLFGEHSAEILSGELGLSAAEVDALQTDKVVVVAERSKL